jgi:hypothetical protein
MDEEPEGAVRAPMASTMGSRDWQFALFDLCVAQAVGAHLEALLLLSLKARPGRVFSLRLHETGQIYLLLLPITSMAATWRAGT